MPAADRFDTPTAESRASLKVSRSEFVGIALPLAEEEHFSAELTRIEKEFYDATHHCWAFRLFADGSERTRSADAGEPSGTAGKPILNAIVSAGLFDVAVVVVRYYGGVKLGTGGLVRAYREAASAALAGVPRVTRYLYDSIDVVVPFARLNDAYRLVAPPDVVLQNEAYGGEENVFTFDVRRSVSATFLERLVKQQLTATKR